MVRDVPHAVVQEGTGEHGEQDHVDHFLQAAENEGALVVRRLKRLQSEAKCFGRVHHQVIRTSFPQSWSTFLADLEK